MSVSPATRWEAWFEAYSAVVRGLPGRVEVPCPDADGGLVRVAFVGDVARRIGIAYAWCDVGRTGIFLHRVDVPAAAPMISFEAAADEKIQPLVPGDVLFLPPDQD